MRKLYYDGKIVTMDGQKICDALGVEDGKIVFAGTAADAGLQAWDEKECLNGRLVLPAFTDTHMHVLHYAMLQEELNLYGTDALEKMIAMGKEKVQSGASYVFGMGWNQEVFENPVFPQKEDMDKISGDIPVIMLRTCGHIAVVNSKALEMIRNMDIAPDVMANVNFEKGWLKESAMRLYMSLIPKRDAAYIQKLFLSAQKKLNRYGIAAVHSDDMASIPGTTWRDVVEAMTKLDQENQMTVHLREQCLVFDANGEFENFVRETKELRAHPGKYFEIGPRKLLQDGSLGAKSACMIHGYADDPDNHGIPTYTDDELYQQIKEADRQQMDVAVHAIGDLAVQKVIDALEKVIGESDRPSHMHGIVHAQFVTEEDMARMAALGIQAYIQPIFINSDLAILDQRVLPEYQSEGYAWKSLQEAGILTSGGSDCPVEFFDPLKNIYTAVARKSLSGGGAFAPNEALSVYDAVRLFTSSAAKAGGHAHDRGMIKENYAADFVVIDKDIFGTEPEEIKEANVIKTVVGGHTVYQA